MNSIHKEISIDTCALLSFIPIYVYYSIFKKRKCIIANNVNPIIKEELSNAFVISYDPINKQTHFSKVYAEKQKDGKIDFFRFYETTYLFDRYNIINNCQNIVWFDKSEKNKVYIDPKLTLSKKVLFLYQLTLIRIVSYTYTKYFNIKKKYTYE